MKNELIQDNKLAHFSFCSILTPNMFDTCGYLSFLCQAVSCCVIFHPFRKWTFATKNSITFHLYLLTSSLWHSGIWFYSFLHRNFEPDINFSGCESVYPLCFREIKSWKGPLRGYIQSILSLRKLLQTWIAQSVKIKSYSLYKSSGGPWPCYAFPVPAALHAFSCLMLIANQWQRSSYCPYFADKEADS